MKKLFCILIVVLSFIGCLQNDCDYKNIDEVNLPGTYIMSKSTIEFESGYITFNSDYTMDGEILFSNPVNDCVFDGGWFFQEEMLIINISSTSNLFVIDFGPTAIKGIFANNGDLSLSFQKTHLMIIRYK
jgi:hypothetical protein